MKDEKQVIMKNGRHALSEFCTICGTKMFKISGDRKKVVKAKTVTKKPTARVKTKSTTKRVILVKKARSSTHVSLLQFPSCYTPAQN
jgi:hypothetical protein